MDTGVEHKCEKLREDQDLGRTVNTGVEQQCEIWKEDQDLGHTVDTVVVQKCEKEKKIKVTQWRQAWNKNAKN